MTYYLLDIPRSDRQTPLRFPIRYQFISPLFLLHHSHLNSWTSILQSNLFFFLVQTKILVYSTQRVTDSLHSGPKWIHFYASFPLRVGAVRYGPLYSGKRFHHQLESHWTGGVQRKHLMWCYCSTMTNRAFSMSRGSAHSDSNIQ